MNIRPLFDSLSFECESSKESIIADIEEMIQDLERAKAALLNGQRVALGLRSVQRRIGETMSNAVAWETNEKVIHHIRKAEQRSEGENEQS